MELTILGTGNALVSECYNTCFVLKDHNEYFMVDGGGGNGILSQLKAANLDWRDMRHIFVTHKHIDHIMGIVWMMRLITQNMVRGKYEGDAYIYGHDEVIELLKELCLKLIGEKQYAMLDTRVHMVTLKDGDSFEVMGDQVTAFDIQSTKAKQFGFTIYYGDKKLTCCGDEPYKDCEYEYALNSDWMLHEAFCLERDKDIYQPYKKAHSTVKYGCEKAEELHIKNLILYHTEEDHLKDRKELYTNEGKQYFTGNLYVPDDLEKFNL